MYHGVAASAAARGAAKRVKINVSRSSWSSISFMSVNNFPSVVPSISTSTSFERVWPDEFGFDCGVLTATNDPEPPLDAPHPYPGSCV